MNYYNIGRTIGYGLFSDPTFETIDFGVKKKKKCDKGYGCGGACISTKKNCKVALNGEAKNFAQYVRQNKKRLTKAQKSAARRQNIGLKTNLKMKRAKRNILPEKKNKYFDTLPEENKKLFSSAMKELKTDIDSRWKATKGVRHVQLYNEKLLNHQIADDFHTALKKGYNPVESAEYAKTRIKPAIDAYNRGMSQIPQIPKNEHFQYKTYEKEIDRLAEVFKTKVKDTPEKQQQEKTSIKRYQVTKELGSLENTVIPQAIARQRKAQDQLKSLESDLTRLQNDKSRYGKSVGAEANRLTDKNIAETKNKISSAKKEAEEAEQALKNAQSKKEALQNELKDLPLPKITPVSLDKITKPLSKEESDLIRLVSGEDSYKQNIPDPVRKIADQFGGIDSMRATLKDYKGAASLSMKRFLKDTASDPRPPLDRLRSQMTETNFKKNEIAFKREIEIDNATQRAKKLGMDDGEAAAIISYTTNGYVGMNGYMRGLSLNPDSSKAKYQEVMARATYQAAKKLPNFEGEVQRGSREPESRIRELEAAMQSGQSVSFSGFTSTSKTTGTIEGGYGKSAKEQAQSGKGLEKAAEWQELNNRAGLMQWDPTGLKSVSYSMKLKNGKEISQVSSQPKEQEVLVLPDSKFKVKAVRYDGDKAEIELEEE